MGFLSDIFGGGGDEVPFIPPSPQERALTSSLADLSQQGIDLAGSQQQLSSQLLPLFLENIGLQGQFGEGGALTGLSRAPLSEQQQRIQGLTGEIEQGFLERTRAALAGELPVNPALLSDLERQETDLRNTLRKQLGTGFETSSPGIEALARFQEGRTGALESARRGDLTLGEQLGIARQQQNLATQQIGLGNMLGLNTFQGGALSALQGAAGIGSTTLSQMLQGRGLQQGVANANAQLSQQSSAGLGSLFGTLLTAPLGGTALGSIGGAIGGVFGPSFP